MKSTKVLPRQNNLRGLLASQASVLILAAGFFVAGVSATAQEVQHLTVTRPGGFPGLPVMCGIERTTNGVAVRWDGPSGYYQLYQAPGITNKTWQKVGSPSLTRKATITSLSSNAFFRVQGPSPRYAGAATCAECHESIHNTESYTRHAGAFTNASFVAQGGQTNSSCLPCHTVGYGLPTGFVSKNDADTNPRLTGVQCESCHGPAAAHAANEVDFTVRPRVELAGQVCGGCHSGSRTPTFDEWKTSGHFAVVEDMNPPNRISNCGRCHSGSARLALIKGEDPAVTVANDANVGITCVVCHDPHENHVWTNVVTGIVYTNQLRQALSSTNDFFLTTSDTFTNKYNPNINICAQCHNHRGASWTSSSRPPHHSPQYNMLLSTVGVLPDGVSGGPSGHAGTEFLESDSGKLYLVTNQCVTCHMQPKVPQPGIPQVPGVIAHSFEVTSYGACTGCHGDGQGVEWAVAVVQEYVYDWIHEAKDLLDRWAISNAPPEIKSYGKLAWEYDNAGDLSNPTGDPAIHGPHSDSDAALDEQKYIPENIKKARFDLYLVLYDGSYGVHNYPYASTLLNSATNWIWQELNNK